MSPTALKSGSSEFRRAVESAARQLVTVEHLKSGALINTPILYPNGSTVVVRVYDGQGRYFVSDFGQGYQEAEMMGASNIFMRHAREVAENAGVQFDNQSFFVLEASKDQLPGAIVTVAACSQEAVNLSAFKLAEHKHDEEADTLYVKLTKIFTPSLVTKRPTIVGSSTHKWPVDALVKIKGHGAIFETVSSHHVSVTTAAAKFHDIARLENAPGRVAVVRKKAEFGDFLSLLSQAANVIEFDSSDKSFNDVASAA